MQGINDSVNQFMYMVILCGMAVWTTVATLIRVHPP